jgi:hypothetical protein
MFLKSRSYIYPVFLFLFTVAVFSASVVYAKKDSLPAAKRGIIDLRKTDLQKLSVPITGEWAFYWGQLLTPSSPPKSPDTYLFFPKLFNKTILNGTRLPAKGYASYAVTVLLPPRTHTLALQVPDTYCSYRLFVNNQLFANAGSPDILEEKASAKWVEKTIEITDPADTLHLLLQVANYWHSKGGPYKNIVIGDKEALFYEQEKDEAFDLVLTGCLFMGGLFFFGLFLFGRHDKSILYFALFCMVYSYRMVGARSYVLHTLFPDIPWNITTHLEYLSLFISLVFFSLYTRYLYPEESGKLATQIEVWLGLILSAIVVIFPPEIFTYLINPFLVVMFGVIAYAFYVYVKAMQHKRLGAEYALLSTGVVLMVFIVINLQYFDIITAHKGILFIGYISFFFSAIADPFFPVRFYTEKSKRRSRTGIES